MRGRDNDYIASCEAFAPWQTRVNGTAAYMIPKVDVLVATLFTVLPRRLLARRPSRTARREILWNPEREPRNTAMRDASQRRRMRRQRQQRPDGDGESAQHERALR